MTLEFEPSFGSAPKETEESAQHSSEVDDSEGPEQDSEGLQVAVEAARLTAAAYRSRIERLHRDRHRLRQRLELERWRITSLRRRRWVRLGVALRNWSKRPWRIDHLIRSLRSALVRLPPLPRPEATENTPAFPNVAATAAIQDYPLPAGPVARPGLRVAAILDDFSTVALQYEFELILFGQDDWLEVLSRHRPAFLFVESAWRGNTRRWSYKIATGSEASPELRALVDWCRQQGIPTVFWNKEDPPNFEVFQGAASLFDWILTVDEGSIPRYQELVGHDRISCLPFAAQPRIHNPIRQEWRRKRPVAFAGGFYADKHPHRVQQIENVLIPALQFGLDVFSRFENLDRHKAPGSVQARVKGQLTYPQVLTAYRRYRVFLNVNSVVDSPTTFSRRVFEILACGTPVVSGESVGIERLLGPDVVSIVRTPEETEGAIRRLLASPELADRVGHVARRRILAEHTYGHRVSKILELLQIPEDPRTRSVSVVVPTNKPQQLTQVLENLGRQVYPTVEVVLLAHGFEPDGSDLRSRFAEAGIANLSLIQVDQSTPLGAVMNMGVAAASGDFIAKMDDDNYYGPNYLSDLVDAFTFADADIVGKWAHFTYFESSGAMTLRFPYAEHAYVDLVQGGTIMARADVFDEISFPPLPRGSDTGLLRAAATRGMRTYSSDRFNFINVRRSDQTTHTWQIDEAEMLSTSRVIFFGRGESHVAI